MAIGTDSRFASPPPSPGVAFVIDTTGTPILSAATLPSIDPQCAPNVPATSLGAVITTTAVAVVNSYYALANPA